jgi:hypothetical protein
LRTSRIAIEKRYIGGVLILLRDFRWGRKGRILKVDIESPSWQ